MLRTLMGMAVALTMTAAVEAQSRDWQPWTYIDQTDPMTDRQSHIVGVQEDTPIAASFIGFACDDTAPDRVLLAVNVQEFRIEEAATILVRVDSGEVHEFTGFRGERGTVYRALAEDDFQGLLTEIVGAQTRVVFSVAGETKVAPARQSTRAINQFLQGCASLTPRS